MDGPSDTAHDGPTNALDAGTGARATLAELAAQMRAVGAVEVATHPDGRIARLVLGPEPIEPYEPQTRPDTKTAFEKRAERAAQIRAMAVGR